MFDEVSDDSVLQTQEGFHDSVPSGEDSLEGPEHFFFRFVLEQLLVELKHADSRVFVAFFERVFVSPVQVSVLVFALHPVSKLLVLAGEILLQLFLVATPISLEFLLGFLHVPIDRFGLDLSDCLTLDEVCFFVSGGPRHGAAQLGSTKVLAHETHGLKPALKLATFGSLPPSH